MKVYKILEGIENQMKRSENFYDRIVLMKALDLFYPIDEDTDIETNKIAYALLIEAQGIEKEYKETIECWSAMEKIYCIMGYDDAMLECGGILHTLENPELILDMFNPIVIEGEDYEY